MAVRSMTLSLQRLQEEGEKAVKYGGMNRPGTGQTAVPSILCGRGGGGMPYKQTPPRASSVWSCCVASPRHPPCQYRRCARRRDVSGRICSPSMPRRVRRTAACRAEQTKGGQDALHSQSVQALREGRRQCRDGRSCGGGAG
jgi:hypothetical protein